ncbi:ABC transporter [Gracilaria domingensis]|nr:ABC transporter [Gracilaria domingensis]
MSLVIVAFMPVIALVGGIVAFISNREGKAVNEASGRATGTVHETISLIRSVLAYGGQATEQARYKYDLDDLYRREIRRTGAVAFGTGFLMLVLMGCFAAGFLVGSTFVTDGVVSLAGAVAATAVVPAVFAAFRVANSQKEVADASTAAQSLFEVIDRKPSINPLDESGIIIEDFRGGITFENVDFKYETDPNPQNEGADDETHEHRVEPNTLSNFNFEMQPGSSHALCGPSGSGKSTVVSLIERFYDVTGGRILLDGKVDVRDVNIRWLRSQIGHVGQTPSLLQGTVRQNIENGVPSDLVTDPETGKQSLRRRFVPLQEVIAAAKAAHAHDFIEGLPDGYETQVGEGGALLSGGQKQRICIARALIRNPKILLLDESTASLDNNSEAIVQRALDEAAANRTTLTIAHRLSSLRNTEHVNVLAKGKLVETGTHEALMDIEGGVYRNMVELQLQKTPDHSSDSVRGDDLPGRGDSTTTDPSARDAHDDFVMPEDAIMLNSSSDMVRKISRKDRLARKIFAMQKQDVGIIGLGVFGSIAVGVAWPLAAACIAELLHVGVAVDRGSELLKWSLLLLGCGIGAFIGILVQHTFLTMSGERLTRRARIKAFGAILSKDMSYFDRKENDAGSMSVKLNTQVPLLRQLSSDAAGCAALGFSSVITGLTIAFYYCPLVSLATALFVPGLLLSGYSVFKVGVNYTDKKVIESVRIAAEAVYAIRTVSAFGLEHDYIQRYETLVLNRGDGGKAFSKTIFPSIMMAYIAASPHALFGASFWVGSIVLRDGKCDLLDMNKAILGLFFGSVLVGDVTHVVPKPKRAKLAAAEYFDLTDSYTMEIAKNKRITGTKSINVKGDIDIKEVRFTYPNRPEVAVLKGLSTKVKAGQTLALVGESGSGKSTIISLIERFYGSRKGSILIDGMDVNDIELSELRSMIGLVHQNPELFNRTVRENIAYGLSHEDGTYIPQEQIEEAARIANIHDFITTLPEGYDTVVGVRGDKLSGGQKQRVAIARAVVRQPPILLLDEATSALDVGSEKLVQEGLDAAATGRTTITIAHRLATIRNADRIAVVQSGVIVEEGAHQDLVRKNGLYADLLRSQASHEDTST